MSTNKFEEMLERLINEDKEGAEELFHEIVVEKSREIYENLLEDDLDDEEVDEATDEEVDESDDEEVDEASDEEVDESDDDDEEVSEDFDLDEFEVEADPMAAMGGDPADDMMGDVEMPADDAAGDMGGEEGDEDLEDRVMDLEDALDDLKAEFDKMMAGEEGEEEGDMDMDMDMGGDEDEGEEGEEAEEESVAFEADEDADKEVEESKKSNTPKSAAEQMREYVEKIGGDQYQSFGKMGDNGANTKSPVAGKNDMGGTASNLVQGGEGNNGDHNGLAGTSPKDMSTGNVNVPGGKAGKSLKSNTKGHGAEKKGGSESGANTTPVLGK